MERVSIISIAREELAEAVSSGPISPPSPITSTTPWIGMSILQKGVRRGREDLALRAAATLLRDAPDKLWRPAMWVAKLVPDSVARRYQIEIHTGVSAAEMAEAEQGTVRGGRLVHPMNPERSSVEIKTIRGDYRDADGTTRNRLRMWEKLDFVLRPDDVYQERLYCVQWMSRESLHKGRPETFFAGVTKQDAAREGKVEAIVRDNLIRWQEQGIVPDMPIEPGDETTRLYRERGWTHWHHMFNARQIFILSQAAKASKQSAASAILLCD